jgi:Mrp family chromosome partitioning ATPase
MKAILGNLRDQYDMILIDTPPLLPVTDAAAIAPATDGALLVCRYKKTKREQVLRATNALESVGAPVLGTILTMQPHRKREAYAKYGYSPNRAGRAHIAIGRLPDTGETAAGYRP